MGDILRIYSGGSTQVNLYDSTNGVLHLGFAGEDIIVESEPQAVPLSRGGAVETKQIVSFEATLLETDSTKIDNLIARKGYLQEVYIIGIDHAYKMRDCFIKIKEIRTMKGGEAHMLVLSGQRYQESVSAAADLPESDYCQFIQNILGAFGACSTDGGGGIATGWTNDGATGLSVDTSHLGGGFGNEQRCTVSDAGDMMYCRVRFPLDQQSIKMTVSVYVDNIGGVTANFNIGIRTRNAADAVLDTNTSENLSVGVGADARQTYTVTFTPSAAVQYVEFWFTGNAVGNAQVGFDNAQLEIGSLTAYVENA